MEWTVYILKCGDGTLYTGVTNDIARRLDAHARGTGAKYTKGRGPLKLLYAEPHDSKGSALRREAAIKALRRPEKMKLASKAKAS